MIKIMLALTTLPLATVASAQLNPTPSNLASSAKIQQGSAYPYNGLRGVNFGDTTNPGPICLREKATGKNVCHSRARWKAIAARIDAGQSPD